jgi:hypothetical protein
VERRRKKDIKKKGKELEKEDEYKRIRKNKRQKKAV